MPNHDPHRPGPGQPSDPRRSSVDAGVYEERECRSCGSTITAPYPNQFECDSCETLKSKLDVKSPSADEIGTQEESLQDDPTIPSELERDVIIAELPEIETQPKSRRKILRCIDGSGNEDKFRALHIEGDWERYYGESSADDPFQAAISGYLWILAFYSKLSVVDMDAFYRSSALYDSDLWNGWDRLELLENAIEGQAQNDEGWRVYGSEEGFEHHLSRARRRLGLIERRLS
jgi:hypothetical protein